MTQGRWRRFLPDRSQLWIPIAIVVLVLAGIAFFNLASSRHAAELKLNIARDQVEQLEQQGENLAAEATAALSGGSGEVDAHGYFKLVRPGETRVVAETSGPTPTPGLGLAAGDGASSGWLEWLKRLVNP